MSIYTHKERIVKCKTIGNAVAEARSVLLHIYNITQLCGNSIRPRHHVDDVITIEEMSHWVKQLVDDTLYHEGFFTNTTRMK